MFIEQRILSRDLRVPRIIIIDGAIFRLMKELPKGWYFQQHPAAEKTILV